MSAQSIVDNTLQEILVVLKPLPEDWETRMEVIHELRGVIESVESLRGATVEPFGSFVSKLFTRWGDLDVSVEFAYGSFTSPNGKKRKKELLRKVLKAMREKGGWRNYELVPNARVPILKVSSNRRNIACDISVDNLKCQMKSKIFLWISEIDARFRDMVLLVKEWAKAHNINNPKFGTFNSYSLTLLVVFHFQTCSPAIFPPLKDIYPGNLIDDLKGLRADTEELIAEICVSNIKRLKAGNLGTKNRSSLSELFVSFLGKFSDVSLKASKYGICTYTGQWEAIESNMRWLPQTYAVFMEDPFEQPENTARAVSKKELTRISESFKISCSMLISATHGSLSLASSQSNILATLVRPQTLHHIRGGGPVYNFEHRLATLPQQSRAESSHWRAPNYHYGPQQPNRPRMHSPAQMQPHHVHKMVHTPAQVQPRPVQQLEHVPSQVQPRQVPQTGTVRLPPQMQPQFQAMKPKSSSNRSTIKTPPSQTSQDQPQKIWRPRSEKQV